LERQAERAPAAQKCVTRCYIIIAQAAAASSQQNSAFVPQRACVLRACFLLIY